MDVSLGGCVEKGEMIRSRYAKGDCTTGVSGRNALKPLMGPSILGVGGFGGCGYTGTTGIVFDFRTTYIDREDLSANILIFYVGLFWQLLENCR